MPGDGCWELCAVEKERGYFFLMTAADGSRLALVDRVKPQDVMVGIYSSEEDWKNGDACLGSETFDSVQEGIDYFGEEVQR